MGRWGIIAGIALLAACSSSDDDKPRRAAAEPPRSEDAAKLTRQCHAELRREDVEFKVLPDRRFGAGCSALGSVQLLEIGTPTANLGAMTCPLARNYARWTREAVQPAARAWLGSKVARIESFGTYACRPVNGMAGGKLSEHGRANAVDISAFVLANGQRITVLEGWNHEDDDVRRFLRAIHQAGCRRFGVTLGPEANKLHHNHFHFDMGRGPYCR
ncbi:MAG TPA: extensin family protein [Allosphingosinicella sp.]|jgi:hypothetical protein